VVADVRVDDTREREDDEDGHGKDECSDEAEHDPEHERCRSEGVRTGEVATTNSAVLVASGEVHGLSFICQGFRAALLCTA